MASTQCYKPVEQTCNQAQYSSQCTTKTEAYYSDHEVAKTQSAHCYSQTQASNPNPTHTQTHYTDQNKAHGIGIGIGARTNTQTHCTDQNKPHGIGVGGGQTHSSNGTGASACHKKRGERKHRGLIQRIKDGLSGDNSSSSSSSDSESDDERCGKPKPTC